LLIQNKWLPLHPMMSHKTAGGSSSGVLRQAKRQSRTHWAICSRTWNWVRSPIRNPLFPQFPRLPLFKEILKILTKLRKKYKNTRYSSKKNRKKPLRRARGKGTIRALPLRKTPVYPSAESGESDFGSIFTIYLRSCYYSDCKKINPLQVFPVNPLSLGN